METEHVEGKIFTWDVSRNSPRVKHSGRNDVDAIQDWITGSWFVLKRFLGNHFSVNRVPSSIVRHDKLAVECRERPARTLMFGYAVMQPIHSFDQTQVAQFCIKLNPMCKRLIKTLRCTVCTAALPRSLACVQIWKLNLLTRIKISLRHGAKVLIGNTDTKLFKF